MCTLQNVMDRSEIRWIEGTSAPPDSSPYHKTIYKGRGVEVIPSSHGVHWFIFPNQNFFSVEIKHGIIPWDRKNREQKDVLEEAKKESLDYIDSL